VKLAAPGLALAMAAAAAGVLAASLPAEDRLSLLVDEYLDQFTRRHPSIAAGNGLHRHDDALEDFSAGAIASEVTWLRAYRARLETLDPAPLSMDERVDRRILLGIVDGWLLDLESVRTWTRNPMIYAAAISDGVHNLMTMESAPAVERMAQAASKLRAVPRLIADARDNVRTPPRVFVERGIVMLRGASNLLTADLPLAFAGVGDTALQERLRAAAAIASGAIDAYAGTLERGVAAASGAYAIGTASVEARYRAEEMIDVRAERLLAIGERELQKAQAEFAATANRLDASKTPIEVWRGVLADHPGRGQLVAAAQQTVDDLLAFIRTRRLVELPPMERVVVAAAPEFDLGLASMHSSPPLEPHPVKSFYYVTDARADWPIERQEAWLQKFNYPTLADISAHEVAPGHYVHSLFMRRTPGKVRRIWIGLNPFPQPSSGQDGWAHYAEQLVSDEGFRREDPRYKLAQLSEALTRICRMIAGLRLHSLDKDAWTVEQAATFFEHEAHLPAPAARQEAVRGTYDPTYGGYFLGKLAALTLRRDYASVLGDRFDAREFHERVMTNGIAPWWAHRQLLMPGDSRPVIE
jgi:uncharacterized protein (DUF885 family)